MADMTYGTAQEFFNAAVGGGNLVTEVSDNKFVLAYRVSGATAEGFVRAGSVSGTVITWGDPVSFCSDVNFHMSLCKVDTDKFGVAYADDSQVDDGFCRVGSLSGLVITLGDAIEFETSNAEHIDCCYLEAGKFAIVWNDEGAGDIGKAVIITVSTLTCTKNAEVIFEGYIHGTSCDLIAPGKFAAAYWDSGDADKSKACVFTYVGTTITAGTPADINADTGAAFRKLRAIATDKFAVINTMQTATTITEIIVCTVVTRAITVGTPVTARAATGNGVGLAKISNDIFLTSLEDGADGMSQYSTVSTRTITKGSDEKFEDAGLAYYSDIALISEGKVVIVYYLNGGTCYAIVGDAPSAGWSGGDIGEVPLATIAKINGVALADILKVTGVA